MSQIESVENFYGVYLLYCLNPLYKGRTYIGYTVDPNRRIKQHNKGKHAGGAYRTSNKGPWSMVLIVYGFPNDVSALRFEWAWQHPTKSRRLNRVPAKRSNERLFDYCLRVLAEMLRTGPWNRLPLTIRWINEEFAREFPVDKPPPMHMAICYGSVTSKKVPEVRKSAEDDSKDNDVCCLCHVAIEEEKKLTCIRPNCDLKSHLVCLSKFFLEPGQYVPVSGICPRCDSNLLWGDVIRKYRGCYSKNLNIAIEADMGNSLYESDESD